MHLTFANMHKTLLCERLGLDWVGLGCFWVVFWGWVFYWVGLAQGGLGLGWGDASRYPAVQLNLHVASYSNGLGGVCEALTIIPLNNPPKIENPP